MATAASSSTSANPYSRIYTNEDPHFALELLNVAFKIVGKPLTVNLQRKLDNYNKMEDSNCTQNIIKAVLIYINYHIVSDEFPLILFSKTFKTKKKELVRKYTPSDFLEFLSQSAYACVLEFSKNIDITDSYLTSVENFIKKLRKKHLFGAESWELLDRAAIQLIKADKCVYESLRTFPKKEMKAEKGFVIKLMYYLFDFYSRNLPEDLFNEYQNYNEASDDDTHLKNAIFSLMHVVDEKIKFFGGIDEILLYYYNLCARYFLGKYFMELCVLYSRKAMAEYSNENKLTSPKSAYDLLVYFLQLAQEDGKFNIESIHDAASKILEEDRDRIEHERQRRNYSVENSSESAAKSSDTDSLVASGQQQVCDCLSRCCTLI